MNALDYLLILVLLCALVLDVRYRKIPNVITLTAVVLGVLINVVLDGFAGLVFSLQGLLLGIGVFIVPFILGGMGGGDVKLMGAVGAIKGWVFVLHAGVFTALWGGLIALLAIVITRRFKLLRELGIGLGLFVITKGKIGSGVLLPDKNADVRERLYVPYGIAIFLGTMSAFFIRLPIPG